MEKCRACLTTEGAMNPLDEDFLLHYNILTSLDVKPSDGMPQVVCDTCLQSVKFFINFRAKCIVSESSLRCIVEDVKVDVKQDVQSIKEEYDDCDDTYIDSVDFPDDFNLVIKKEEGQDSRKVKKVKKQYKRTKWKGKNELVHPSSHGEDQLLCGICPKEFLDKNKLDAHLEDHKTCTNCWLCPQGFQNWAHLLGHRIVHLPQAQRSCALCTKRYQTPAGLEFHIRTLHLNEKNVELKCDMCTHTFGTPRQLNKHMWSMHSNIDYVCDYCGKVYCNKQTLRVHIRTHTTVKMFACDMCDFSCKHSGGLKDHKIRKHTAKKVSCGECKRVFEDAAARDKHRCCSRPPAVCPICGLELKRGVRISRHMETHNTVGRYQCPRCPKVYKARGALAVHMNQHDGNRNLRCEQCPATFYHPSALGKHRRVHTGEKPYVCKICHRAFTGNNNLKVHMKVHGEFNLIMKKVKPEVIEA